MSTAPVATGLLRECNWLIERVAALCVQSSLSNTLKRGNGRQSEAHTTSVYEHSLQLTRRRRPGTACPIPALGGHDARPASRSSSFWHSTACSRFSPWRPGTGSSTCTRADGDSIAPRAWRGSMKSALWWCESTRRRV